jgi:hypothetical protein
MGLLRVPGLLGWTMRRALSAILTHCFHRRAHEHCGRLQFSSFFQGMQSPNLLAWQRRNDPVRAGDID